MATAAAAAEGSTAAGFAAGFRRPVLVTLRGRAEAADGNAPGITGLGRAPGGRTPGRGNLGAVED